MKYVEITDEEIKEFNAKKAEFEELKKEMESIQVMIDALGEIEKKISNEYARANSEMDQVVDKLYKKYSPAFKGMLIESLEYEFEKKIISNF